jgi:nicotinamidase/pyrazinamidase
MDPKQDSYSVFQANDSRGRSFSELLERLGVDELYVGGLATDYCVQSSVLDALASGLKVTVLKDGIRGVNLKPHDSGNAVQAMAARGAKIR